MVRVDDHQVLPGPERYDLDLEEIFVFQVEPVLDVLSPDLGGIVGLRDGEAGGSVGDDLGGDAVDRAESSPQDLMSAHDVLDGLPECVKIQIALYPKRDQRVVTRPRVAQFLKEPRPSCV